MNKTKLRFLAALVMLIPVYVFADWNTPDKGYFQSQYGIVAMEPFYTKALATINFEGQIWTFINYHNVGNGQIELRKLSNTATGASINFSQTEETFPSTFSNLGNYSWQPAPVVFNNNLYLFVGNTSNGISFSQYNAGADTWGPLKDIPGNFSCANCSQKLGFGMAAVVIGDRLCLVAQNFWSSIEIFTTTDTALNTWSYYHDNIHSGVQGGNGANDHFGAISAISKTYTVNGVRKGKLMYSYIDGNKHPRLIECDFDDSGVYHQISDETISTECTYQSVAIVEGTVKNDPGSTGDCVQAFLKKATIDNLYQRYRIQRYQSKDDGAWTKQENNLVKQNYRWATEWFNLTAVNFAIPDPYPSNDISQMMCLIYCGYNDNVSWPMICDWVETDKLKFIQQSSITLTDPANVQYVGYIEGPPPFYLNNKPGLGSLYTLDGLSYISELEYTNTVSTANSSAIGYDVNASLSFKFKAFTAEGSAGMGQKWDSDTKTTITNGISIHATPQSSGFYLTLQPIINKAVYKILDWSGNIQDTTYYFSISPPHSYNQPYNLQENLKIGAPETYRNRDFLSTYDNYGSADNSWTTGGLDPNNGISIETSESQTNTYNGSVKLGLDLGEFFNVGIEGSIDYEMSTTTSVGDDIKSSTGMNEPSDTIAKDISELAYTTWWIKRTAGKNNWWFYPGQDTTQNTWCLTYNVYHIKYVDGTILSDKKPDGSDDLGETDPGTEASKPGSGEQLSPAAYSLSQNCPNPFNPTTKIKYQVGIENPNANSSDNSCLTKLVVYNLNGQEVATLVNENKAPGNYEVEWDASQLTPGVYFYSLQSGSFKDVKKLIRLK
jgi:hypothetical protein